MKMNEQQILSNFSLGLRDASFYICFQPQINHSTKRMIGAEALVRWKDEEFGMQYPSDFIPVLERHNLITKLDLYVVEKVCIFIRKCLDEQLDLVPVSFNLSRYDLCEEGYLDSIEKIRQQYAVPVKYLRVEITESAIVGGLDIVLKAYKKLHSLGYLVEMDDFGSGYSSISVLKDFYADIIKLDMRFWSGGNSERTGAIINAVIQMAKGLNASIIAEGVETIEQADFLKSFGCDYIQGYVYARPMAETDFLDYMSSLQHETSVVSMEFIHNYDKDYFWSSDLDMSQFFEHYSGPSAFFKYGNGHMHMERVNHKYLVETGMNTSVKDVLNMDPLSNMDECQQLYLDAINKAIRTNEEQVVETWRTIFSKCCGEDHICIRSTIRLIARDNDEYLFYVMIQNITQAKKHLQYIETNEDKLLHAAEQANVYAWEYTVATKEMRPCSRCRRDLGLPPVVKNYPEPVIGTIFPSDYGDLYRNWHKQIENGAEFIEGIIPLTENRVPFHVRYTTEFDENGKPLKAYGSATMVVNSNE